VRLRYDRRMRVWAASIVLAVCGRAGAQPPEPESHAVCALGQRLPYCKSVFVLEGAARWGNVSTQSVRTGLLVAYDRDHSFGATMGIIGYTKQTCCQPMSGTAVLLELRYRHWLGDQLGLDLGAAALYGSARGGGMADISLEVADAIALTASVDAVPLPSGIGLGANLGIRVGSGLVGVSLASH